jgi:hypothetical protein
MPPPRRRPFTVLDAMVLVAATAVGLAVMRSDPNSILYRIAPAIRSHVRPDEHIHVKLYLITGDILEFQPLLLVWTYAALILRLRGPRPGIRRLARQPGFAALLTAVVCSAYAWLDGLTHGIWELANPDHKGHPLEDLTGSLSQLFDGVWDLGAAVSAVWAFMALGQICRREPSWIDRLGRILGGGWIAATALRIAWPCLY